MVQLSEVAGLQLNFKYTINYWYIRPSINMNPHPTVRFNDPPVTKYYSTDVDDSTQSRTSADDLYLGPDDDIEDDSMSSSGPDVLATSSDQSPPAQSDQPVQYINPDLYLGPDEDLIDCDDEPGSVYAHCESPVPSEVSMSYERPAECNPAHPELTNEDLYAMVREFRPIGSFKHSGLQSLQDRLSSYKHDNGGLPVHSIPLLIEAERPFQMGWADTSDKLRRADAELQRLRRAEQASIEMLKVVDSMIRQCEEQNQN
ncbi:uncharacterized protein EDB91DRAFT_1257077 [Suillus paluster]|uniref:uncharacterized protein n=1 Tax=Suillus paluster TaxID=48578 RepID=UPI001B86CD9C|nr:uncharacterized protein EDB91DRAFT_1257077 [Suillus paluster]KAG1720226.1 hypothetical protein EDB91DRAFT_1257077 [Suillus paluster]